MVQKSEELRESGAAPILMGLVR